MSLACQQWEVLTATWSHHYSFFFDMSTQLTNHPFVERKHEALKWEFKAYALESWLCHSLICGDSLNLTLSMSHLKTVGDSICKAHLCLSHDIGKMAILLHVLAQIQFCFFFNCSKILPICAASRYTSSSFNFNGEAKYSRNYIGNKSREKYKSQHCVMGASLHLQDLKLSARLR